MTARPWPTREEWAAGYNRVYADDVDKVVDAVPTTVSTYATPDQVAAAVAELRAAWKAMHTRVVSAIHLASQVFPPYGTTWTEETFAQYEALSRDAVEIIEDADRIRTIRHYVGAIASELEAGQVPAAHTAKLVAPEAGPAFEAVLVGYRAATAQVALDYITRIETRVPDDEAWRKELDRRARIEDARAERTVYRSFVNPPIS